MNKTPRSLRDLENTLRTESRLAGMYGSDKRAASLDAHAERLESLDPVYAQTKDASSIIAKARRALRAVQT